jgi:hypothetical protein
MTCFVVITLGSCGLPCRKVCPQSLLQVLICSSSYHAIMIIVYHRIRCTIYMFRYVLASYRIAGGVASSSLRGADRVRSIRSSGTGGVRGRRVRRGSTWVCGPPTQFLRTRQAPEHSKYRSWLKPLMHYYYPWLPCYTLNLLSLGSYNCLALLRPVVIGDFRSPKMIGGY